LENLGDDAEVFALNVLQDPDFGHGELLPLFR